LDINCFATVALTYSILNQKPCSAAGCNPIYDLYQKGLWPHWLVIKYRVSIKSCTHFKM